MLSGSEASTWATLSGWSPQTCHAERQRSIWGDGWLAGGPGRRPAAPLPTTNQWRTCVVGRGAAGLSPGSRGPPNVFVMACQRVFLMPCFAAALYDTSRPLSHGIIRLPDVPARRLWQELIGIQGVEVHLVNRLAGGVEDAVGVEDELRVAVPGGSVLPAPLMAGVGVARAEEALAGKDQARIGEGAFRSLIYQHLRRLLRVRLRVFVATHRRRHKLAQQVGLLLDLGRTGDDIGRVIVGDAIVDDGEDIDFEAIALRLNHLPALENPGKIDAVRLQRLHRVHAQRHALKDALAPRVLDNLTHHRGFVGCAKRAIDLAVEVARAVQAGACQRDQRGRVVLDDGGDG